MVRPTLVLTHRPPWPPTRGDSIRSWAVLGHLARRGPTHLVTFGDPADPELDRALGERTESHVVVPRARLPLGAGLRALATGGPLSVAAFTDPRFARAVQERLRRTSDARTYAFSGQMARYAPDGAILDLVDVDHAKFAAYAATARDPLRRALYRREARTLACYEREQAERASAVLLVSEAEAAVWQSSGGGGAVRVIGNGIDTDHFDPDIEWPRPAGLADRPILLFTGQMDYAPNVAAVQDFARDVLPRLAGTGALFAIAGRAPTPTVRALAGPNVIVTGAVEDMRPWLAHATVVVAPLAIARGVQNKVLEALAMARPVVASSPALTGLALVPDREVVAADGAEATASAIAELLNDEPRRLALGRAGRQRMVSDFGWAARLGILDTLLDGCERFSG